MEAGLGSLVPKISRIPFGLLGQIIDELADPSERKSPMGLVECDVEEAPCEGVSTGCILLESNSKAPLAPCSALRCPRLAGNNAPGGRGPARRWDNQTRAPPLPT